ncbi:MAG: antibiotic biosynthesis monooxygenase family protein [Halanaeroarchaeum sp.]
MIVVANRFRIAEGYEDAFVERFQENLGGVSDFEGFVSFELLVPGDDDTETFVALTRWESREDFEAWTDSEAFAKSHSGDAPREMFEGHPILEIHDVAHSEG